MRASKTFRSTISVLVTSALVAAFAPALVWLAAASAAAADTPTVTPDKPLSVTVDTMARCKTGSGEVPGITVGGTCYPGANSSLQVVALSRADLTVQVNTLYSGIGILQSEWDSYHGDLLFLSAPNGFTAVNEKDLEFLAGLGIASAAPPNSSAKPFSVVGVSGACPTCATANDGRVLDVRGRDDEQGRTAGEIVGYLQRDDKNNYNFVSPDYVAFDTAVPGSPANSAPAMRVGSETYQSPDNVPSGSSGFEVLSLSADDLAPVGPDPAKMYVTNDANGAADAAGIDGLKQALTTADRLVLVQAFGRPRAASTDWNSLADDLADLGATKPLVMSLNNPGLPGLHSPTGYALAAFTGVGNAFGVADTSTAHGAEAWQAAPGETVSLHGMLARTYVSAFAPQLADSSGLFDPTLEQITFQKATARFPFSADPAVTEIWNQLSAGSQGHPFPKDAGATDLRDEYWIQFGNPDWASWSDELADLTNPDPSSYPLYSAVQAQLLKEFHAVESIRTALYDADPDSPLAALKSALDANQNTLAALSNYLQDQLKNTQAPPPTPSVLDIVLNVLTIVAGVTAASPAFDAIGNAASTVASLASSAAVVTAGGMGVAASLASAGGEGLDAAIDGVNTTATSLAAVLTNQLDSTIDQEQRVGQILVADYGKLMAAGSYFASKPELTTPSDDTKNALEQTFETAGEQEVFQQLLPSALESAYNDPEYEQNNVSSEKGEYPNRCLATPALDEQASVERFTDDNGVFGHVDHSEYFFYVDTPDSDLSKLAPAAELVQAMYDPVGTTPDPISGVPAAGLDPEIFLAHAGLTDWSTAPNEYSPYQTPDTFICQDFKTAELADPGAFARLGTEPSPVVLPMNGGGQRAATGDAFADPLTVRVTNSEGMPLESSDAQPVTVDFSTPAADFGTFQPPGASSSAIESKPTGPAGLATTDRITAGTSIGSWDLRATCELPNPGNIPPAEIRFTNEPAVTVSVLDDGLQAAKDSQFPLPLAVQVNDPDNKAVAGEPVQFQIDSGPASFFSATGSTAAAVRTDTDGYAFTPPIFTSDSTGTVTVSISIPGHHEDSARATATLHVVDSPTSPSVTIALTADPAGGVTVGEPVNVAATVTGYPFAHPTGSVSFTIDGGPPTVIDLDAPTGVAALPALTDLPPGPHTIKASYSGDGIYGAASTTIPYQVAKLSPHMTVTSTANASAVGQSIAFTAKIPAITSSAGITFPASGTVAFKVGTRDLGLPVRVTNGTATSPTIDSLDPGIYNVQVDYSGDDNYAATSVTYVQAVIGKWNTTVNVSSNAGGDAVVGQHVVYSVKVATVAPGTSTPTGNVRFLDDYTAIPGCDGLPLSDGTATCTTSYPATGSHTIAVAYTGDPAHEANESDGMTQAVVVARTSTALSADPPSPVVGEQVSLNAVVSVTSPGDAPVTGSIEFDDGGTPIAGCAAVAVDADGVASCTIAWQNQGDHGLTATYSGSDLLSGSSGDVSVHVDRAPTSTALTITPATSHAGEAVELTADIQVIGGGSGTPGGSITFLDGDVAMSGCGTIEVTGGPNSAVASCTIAFAHVGTHGISAHYSGDTNFVDSSSAVVQLVVGKATTATTLTVTPGSTVTGQTVTLSATVQVIDGAGKATGTIAFRDGGQPVTDCGAIKVTPGENTATASCTLVYDHAGAHQLTAAYSGDDDFTASVSDAVQHVIAPAATTLVADKAAFSLRGGYTFTTHLSRSWDAAPISGETVEITAGKTAVCTAVTDATGTAACNSAGKTLTVTLTGHYTATFAGDDDYLTSTTTGKL